MAYWEKYIIEGRTSSEKRKMGEKLLNDLRNESKKERENKKKKSDYTKYLEKQLEYKKKKYEEQKKRQIERLKERSAKEQEGKVKRALSSVKYDTISHKDADPTAYKKALGNVASAAGALGKAGYEALKTRRKKKKAEKEAAEISAKQPEKKEPGKPGRRPKAPKTSDPKSEVKVAGHLASAPEQKMLMPAKPKGMRLGQRARRNPALKSALISTRMEEYLDFEEEFISEITDDKDNEKKKKKKEIDIMKGKNKIEINPNITENSQHKDEEGYMANVEFDSMERAIKELRKKIKNSDTQLPAWIQSKITRAADYIDSASKYVQSDEKISEEKEGKRYCRLCRKEESKGECFYGPSMWEKYTINEMAPLIAAIGRVALSAGARSGARAAIATAAKDVAKEKLKTGVQNALSGAGQKVQPGSQEIESDEGGASAYKKALGNILKLGEEKSAAWQRKEGKNPEGGLNKKGIKSYRKQHPGSKLSLAVTTEPSKLKKGSKKWKRRKSFCSRMLGMRKKLTSKKTASDPNSRINKSLRAWNC